MHGGTLSQPWPDAFGMRQQFGDNFARNSDEDQKQNKGLRRNLLEHSAENWQFINHFFRLNVLDALM